MYKDHWTTNRNFALKAILCLCVVSLNLSNVSLNSFIYLTNYSQKKNFYISHEIVNFLQKSNNKKIKLNYLDHHFSLYFCIVRLPHVRNERKKNFQKTSFFFILNPLTGDNKWAQIQEVNLVISNNNFQVKLWVVKAFLGWVTNVNEIFFITTTTRPVQSPDELSLHYEHSSSFHTNES